VNAFLSGALMVAALAVALFFLEYWRNTRERLFAVLAIAFAMIGLERILFVFIDPHDEGRHWVFIPRFLVFVLIIAGIVDKNRARRASGEAGDSRLHEQRLQAPGSRG